MGASQHVILTNKKVHVPPPWLVGRGDVVSEVGYQ